jgi:hypothetical protein
MIFVTMVAMKSGIARIMTSEKRELAGSLDHGDSLDVYRLRVLVTGYSRLSLLLQTAFERGIFFDILLSSLLLLMFRCL